MRIDYKNQIKEDQYRIRKAGILVLVVALIGAMVIYKSKIMVEDFFLELAGYEPQITHAEPLAATPQTQSMQAHLDIQTSVGIIDQRAYVLDEYFRANNSKLYGTGQIFVDACDRYGAPADCTTVAAIAKAETDLCNYYNSADYFNCWGFGGGGPDRMYFSGWNESINLVTDRLVNSYGLKYMIDPSLMERTFCGWEPGCTNWGSRVKYFMKEISDYSLKLGFSQSLFDYR